MQDYRAEVRRNYEATEQIFAADMKWRDDWAEDQKKERRKERRRMARQGRQGQGQPGNSVRTAPTEEHLPPDPSIGNSGAAVDQEGFLEDSGAVVGEGEDGNLSSMPPALIGQAETKPLTEEGDGAGLVLSRSTEEAIGQNSGERALNDPMLLSGRDLGFREEAADEAVSLQEKTRGPCQGSCLVENIEGSEDKQQQKEGQPSVRAEVGGQEPSLGQGTHSGEAVERTVAVFRGEEKGEAAV